jgi:hypothetical protein
VTHALPLRPQRSFLPGLTFHSLLPPSQTRDEFEKRHGNGRSRCSVSAAEGRLLDIDEALAETYGIVWQTIDRGTPVVAEVLDRLIVATVDHLEQYLAAARLAPVGSTVSKSARRRQDAILEAIDRVVCELDMQLREQPVPDAGEIEQLFTSRLEQTLSTCPRTIPCCWGGGG